MKEEDVRKSIRDEMARMRATNMAKEVEFVKKAMRKEVGWLSRSSFLAYVYLKLHDELFGKEGSAQPPKADAGARFGAGAGRQGHSRSDSGKEARVIEGSRTRQGVKAQEPVARQSFSRPSAPQPPRQGIASAQTVARRQPVRDENGESCAFWCNYALRGRARADDFVKFIEDECEIPAGSVHEFKSLRNYSFFKVNKPLDVKVREKFTQPALYNGFRVVVRVKGERPVRAPEPDRAVESADRENAEEGVSRSHAGMGESGQPNRMSERSRMVDAIIKNVIDQDSLAAEASVKRVLAEEALDSGAPAKETDLSRDPSFAGGVDGTSDRVGVESGDENALAADVSKGKAEENPSAS